MQYLETRAVPLAELAPFPGNARTGDVPAIAASLAELDQYRSLVVRAMPDGCGVVLAGNHTMAALAHLGRGEARCELIECTDAEALKINLVDNRTAELGGYDDEALARLLTELGGDFEGTGWDEEDLQALLMGAEPPPSGNGDPDDAPEAPAEPRSRPGDVYQLGAHRLLVGDATDVAAVEAMMDGDRSDCMWTDPPYGVEYVGKTKDALTIRNDGAADLAGLLAGAWAVATAALKPGAAFYIAHPAGALYRTFGESVEQAGWKFREGLVWVKNTMVLGHSDYHFKHEPVMFGYTDGYEGRRGRGGQGWYGDDSQTSVFEIDKPPRSEQHPTMKPVALITAMIGNSCPRRGLVYDPFGGSGSTLIAAHQLGFRARLVELDPRYADVICRRFEELTGIVPVLDGEPVSFTGADAHAAA